MRAISVMYDSLNRRYLSPYGRDFAITPNFRRLAEKTVVFDNFYAGSLPCMPARRELHTGRYNFLHRGWGPLEPFDDSAPKMLADNGIYSHFVSDHAHYWQDGGLTYHNKYSSYEFIRGQEGDFWRPQVKGFERNLHVRRQDKVNRLHMRDEADFPHVKAFNAAMDFLEKNREQDNWHLHLEYFDPHEPFFVPEKYKRLYTDQPNDVDWPPYRAVTDADREDLRKMRQNYCALVSMCDAYLGRLLDYMDEHDMWKDTLLMVNTDHGYLLGEHGFCSKNYMPAYNEIANIPFFLWDPAGGKKDRRCSSLAQTIDIPATLLEHFGVAPSPRMQGKSLLPAAREDARIRDYALFGYFGKHVNITDGRHVYMRSGLRPGMDLYSYTLMPTHIFTPFSKEELRATDRNLHPGFPFTDGVPLMRIPTTDATSPPNSCYLYDDHIALGSLLFDLQADPAQEHSVHDPVAEARLAAALRGMMEQSEAPPEQFARLGL